MVTQRYTKEDFIKAYNESSSREEILIRLGLSIKSRSIIPKRCKEYGLDLNRLCSSVSYRIPDDVFIELVKNSLSKRELLIKMELAPKGGNYRTITKRIKNLNLDISHFTGQGWNKDKSIGPRRPIEDYLSNKIGIQSSKLRERLITEGIFCRKCSKCNNIEWNNLPIPLELDHINGDHSNNNLTNLRLLCPNCHAQTDTYRGKNKKGGS